MTSGAGGGHERCHEETALSFRNRFIAVCASPEARTLFEPLGVSHDCRAFSILVIVVVFK